MQCLPAALESTKGNVQLDRGRYVIRIGLWTEPRGGLRKGADCSPYFVFKGTNKKSFVEHYLGETFIVEVYPLVAAIQPNQY